MNGLNHLNVNLLTMSRFLFINWRPISKYPDILQSLGRLPLGITTGAL